MGNLVSRRIFACGCGALLLGAPGLAHATRRGGCSLRAATANAEDWADAERIAWANAPVAREILPVGPRFETLFQTRAQIEVIVGAEAPDNAFAVDGEYIRPNQILLGEALIERYRTNLPDWWRLAVVGVLAHEFGHLWQMAEAPELLDEREPHKIAELHADFLAGYALSFFKREQNIQISTFAQELYALGDLAFNSPVHHGTPDERMAAMIEGYRSGIQPATPPPFEGIAAQALVFARGTSLP